MKQKQIKISYKCLSNLSLTVKAAVERSEDVCRGCGETYTETWGCKRDTDFTGCCVSHFSSAIFIQSRIIFIQFHNIYYSVLQCLLFSSAIFIQFYNFYAIFIQFRNFYSVPQFYSVLPFLCNFHSVPQFLFNSTSFPNFIQFHNLYSVPQFLFSSTIFIQFHKFSHFYSVPQFLFSSTFYIPFCHFYLFLSMILGSTIQVSLSCLGEILLVVLFNKMAPWLDLW